MVKQSIEVWDGANVAGTSSNKRKDVHCPLMSREGLNYWSTSCKDRQSFEGNKCPSSCPYNKDENKIESRW